MSDRAGLTRRGVLVAGLTAAGALWLGPAARGRGATDGDDVRVALPPDALKQILFNLPATGLAKYDHRGAAE